MPPSPKPLRVFFLKALLWLPLAFAIWYYFSILLTSPLRWLMNLVLPIVAPDLFSEVLQQGYLLEVVTRLHPVAAPSVPVPYPGASISFDINPLIYGYSYPLFTALAIATPTEEGQKWWRWALGMGVLLVAQSWGICFDALKTTVIDLGPQLRGQIARGDWPLDVIALGYQFGYLILPAVTPLILWVGLFREFVGSLAPALAERRN